MSNRDIDAPVLDVPGLGETNLFNFKHDIYPLIDPAPLFAAKAYKDRVVLITGGSVGIGAKTASFYAYAGAHLVLVARGAERLEQCKTDIEKATPGAQVVTVVGDISEPETGKKAVQTAVERFGKIDVVIANQFVQIRTVGKFADLDPLAWWHTQEVNVRGTLNIIHPAIPELLKTKGQIIVTTSQAAHMRLPMIADYSISKHTLNRLVEILALDYPGEISFYAVHPGIIWTPGSTESVTSMGFADKVKMPDTLELPAAMFLWLTNRNAEFLNGRYVQATWDLGEVIAKKEQIVKENLLVTKLSGPGKTA